MSRHGSAAGAERVRPRLERFAVLLIATAIVGPLVFLTAIVLRRQPPARRLVAGSLLGTAVLTTLLNGTVTGSRVSDTAGRVLVVALVALLARTASERLLLGAAALATALAAAGPAGPVAAGCLGFAAAEEGRRRPIRWKREAVGAGIGAAAVSLPSFVPLAPLLGAALAGAVVTSGLLAATRAQRHQVARAAMGAGVVVLVLVVGAAVRLRSVPSDLRTGQAAARAGLDDLRSADTPSADAQLRTAQISFDRTDRALHSPLVAPLRFVPLLGQHVELGRDLAGAATELTRTARAVVDDGDVAVLAPKGGRIDLEAVRALGPDVEAASGAVSATRRRVQASQDDWLVPPLRQRLEELDASLAEGGEQLDALAVTLRVLPALLGEDGPRRAFVGFTNPSEVRGVGGIIGNFTELEADGGAIRQTRIGRDADLNAQGRPAAERTLRAPPGYQQTWGEYGPQTLWQNVTLSPDGPSVGEAIADLYPQSGGKPVDVVGLLDTNALGALLELTGPVTVPSWPVALTSANATQILGIEQYERYGNDLDKRTAFLSELTRATFERLLDLDPTRLRQAAPCLGRAVRNRHMVLWSPRPEEQKAFQRLGVTGALPQPTAEEEVAGVVLNNAAGNKLDWFMSHTTKVTRSFDTSTGDQLALVTTTLTNDAPRSGLPDYVAMSVDAGPGARPGDHRLLVSAYGSGSVDAARVSGKTVPVRMSRETDLDVATAVVEIPAGTTREVTFVFRTPSDGRIPRRLTLLPDQPPANEALCA